MNVIKKVECLDILIYIINLESSLKRAESMRQKIAKLKGYKVYIDDKLLLDSTSQITLRFRFFKAIDAKKIESGEITIPNYKPSLSKIFKGKPLSYGEVACFASHYALWQECIKANSKIVVLEDDISFVNNLDGLIKIYKSKFEYVRLMYLFSKGEDIHIGGNFYLNNNNICGTQGYCISADGARKFIAEARNFIYCVDDYMDMSYIHEVPNIIYKPFLISEDVQESTIQGREKVQIHKLRKLTREMTRIYNSIRKIIYIKILAPKIRDLKKLLPRN